MAVNVDLSQLAVTRQPTRSSPPRSRRPFVVRYLLPALLVGGFVALIAFAAREVLYPPRPVTVIPVLSSQAALDPPADTPLFRAAGWVEPRPTATLVTALAEGVVEQLLVVEGEEIRRGQLLARLVAADSRIALDVCEADVRLREGELASAQAVSTAAVARLEQPTHLESALADARVALLKVESTLAGLASKLEEAQSKQAAARRDWEYRQKSSDVPEATLVRSKSEFDSTNAVVKGLLLEKKRLPLEITALESKRDAAQRTLTRKIEETRAAAEARAAITVSEARLSQAKSAREAAQLRLQRMEIKAPSPGRVLALVARPGMRLTGLNPGSLHDSSTVLTLFDPESLQLRVDVRLDDVSRVQSGQKVRIECAALPNVTLDGRVLLATSQADLQKNTLSVKVAIQAPPMALRPDMLCQVTFLAPPPSKAPAPPGTEPYRLLVPRELVSVGDQPTVWVADRLTNTARRRVVELGRSGGDLVEVVSGLAASDKLIVAGREGLTDGDRVRIVGEDETLGIVRTRSKPPL